jgi:hypothetical protein
MIKSGLLRGGEPGNFIKGARRNRRTPRKPTNAKKANARKKHPIL